MTDPLSIAASITGFIAISAKIVGLLRGLYDCRARAKQAPESINRLMEEMQDMNAIFCQVQLFIVGTTKIPNESGLKMLSIQHLLATLSGCILVASNLDKYLSAVIGFSDSRSTQPPANKTSFVFERIEWALWKEAKVAAFIEELQRHKLSLNLMLGIIQCHTTAEASESLGKLHETVSQILDSNHAISIQLRELINRHEKLINHHNPPTSNKIEPATVHMDSHVANRAPTIGEVNIPLSTRKDSQTSNDDDGASFRTAATSHSTLSLRSVRSMRSIRSVLPSFLDELKDSRPYRRLKTWGGMSDDSDSTFSRNSSTRGCSWSMLSNMSLGDLSISEISVLELPICPSDLWDAQAYQVDAPLPSAPGQHKSSHQSKLKWSSLSRNYVARTVLAPSLGTEIDKRDSESWTTLNAAARKGHDRVVKLLLDDGRVDVNMANKDGWTPLNTAAYNGYDKVVELLLADERVDINMAIKKGWTALSSAADNGHDKVVRLLLADSRLDINIATEDGWTPLNSAANNGHDKVTELLLADGRIDVNLPDKFSWTPLHHAADEGHHKVVELLLADGRVDVNLANEYGWTPLNIAANKGHDKVVKMLLADSSVDVNMATIINGWTPLNSAAKNGHNKVVELLLADGRVDVNMAAKNGWTPLTAAADAGHDKVVELLLAHDKIDITMANAASKTALDLATKYRHHKIVARLRSKLEKHKRT